MNALLVIAEEQLQSKIPHKLAIDATVAARFLLTCATSAEGVVGCLGFNPVFATHHRFSKGVGNAQAMEESFLTTAQAVVGEV